MSQKRKINIMKMSHIVLPPVFALKIFVSHYIWGLNQAGKGKKKIIKYPHLAW